MYNIFTGFGYLPKYKTEEVITSLAHGFSIVLQPENADLFLFPVNYEILYGYKEHEYKHFDYQADEIESLKIQLEEMTALSERYQKQIIIFYYFDPVAKINIKNSIIFRTSLLETTRSKNELAMPAYGKDLLDYKQDTGLQELFWLPKNAKPSVGFRGQAAPIKLPAKLNIKRKTNKLLQKIGVKRSFNLHYNFGYLARRDALKSCLEDHRITSDFTLTTLEQSWDPIKSKTPFIQNILNNQYNICVSGHGNYSFRLYEVMSAGRIPVFINTDCVLPFEEFIDWKKHVVWIEEKDAKNTSQAISDFHETIHADDFIQLQKNNRKLWEDMLSKDGFYRNVHRYFN